MLHRRFGQPSTAGTGRGTTIYSLDSGIRLSHQEFQAWNGAGQRVSYGTNIVDGTTEVRSSTSVAVPRSSRGVIS